MPKFNTETEAEKLARRRKAIHEVLLRHRGEIARIANSLGINKVNITQYLHGVGRSKRVADAVERRAAELLIEEHRQKIRAEGRPRDISAREIIDSLRKRDK